MVRRCVVQNCKESDISILSHRFPKTHDIALKWQEALSLENSIDDLQKKFVVCTRHFSPKSYRNEISNSLNTTAIPNLEENLDNERILTTDPSIKKQQQPNTPARCHKLPPVIQKRKLDLNLPLNRVKVIRLHKDEVQEYLKAQKGTILVEEGQIIEEIVPSEDVEETFELCEMTEEIEENEFEICRETIHESEEIFQPEDNQEYVITRFNQETQTKDELTPSQNIPKIIQNDKESQTDLQSPPPQNVVTSKDDKIIKLLYPEFQDLNKIKLIELVNEKDRKIEALEDKIKKLELAMRNLL